MAATSNNNTTAAAAAGSGGGGSPSGWFAIPAPLARLFKKFPLLTYPPNELPARSPQQPRDVATLYVFISDADALKGLPSFNPSCLKWQTFLRLAGLDVRLASSNNHASPNGALPFLIPGSGGSSGTSSSSSSSSSPPSSAIIPSNKLEQYALSYSSSPSSSRKHPNSTTTTTTTTNASTISDCPESQTHRLEAYTSLLDHQIRNAWLYALYLCPANTHLLRHLYIHPTSSSGVVQAVTLAQLRAAAESEITRSSPHNTLRAVYNNSSSKDINLDSSDAPSREKRKKKLYADARSAFAALAALLSSNNKNNDDDDDDDEWFFGSSAPGVLDAAVFAYTHLILDFDGAVRGDDGGGDGARPCWGDRTLAYIVGEFPVLVEHRDRIYRRCWGTSAP